MDEHQGTTNIIKKNKFLSWKKKQIISFLDSERLTLNREKFDF